MIKLKCKICNNCFNSFPSSKRLFCSLKCYYKSKIGKQQSLEHRNKISKRLKGKPTWNKGKKYKQSNPSKLYGKCHPSWKGGRKYVNNYVAIYKPEHPFNNKKYILEHRLIVESIIKRYLLPNEVIHHINTIRDDNKPKNLYLFFKKEHDRFESTKYKQKLISNII